MTYASFDSRCGLCDNDIEEGDEIKLHEGEWCHAQCVDDEPDQAVTS